MHKKIVAIIQARMSSTRLPGKVLLPIGDEPMLWYVVHRTKQAKLVNVVVVATSTDPSDNQMVEYCKKENIECARGHLTDVLSRYYTTAKQYKADIVIRITSDCPLIDGELIDKGITLFADGNYDYISNTVERTFPRGFDFEIFSFKTLEYVHQHATKEPEKEHVTPYIYRNHPQDFKIGQIKGKKDSSNYRITVDTIEDFEVIKQLIEKYDAHKKNASQIIDILDQHPEIVRINAHIEQKQYGK